MNIDAIRREIPALARCTYTNTAGFAPLPRPVLEELQRREELILTEGLDVLVHRPEWEAEITGWRQSVARHFGADGDEIAFGRALGEGLNVVISGLRWEPGDEIIITDQEHPTGQVPALNLAANRGVTIRKLCVAGTDAENLERFRALLGPRTRLAAVSAVTTEVGVRLPVRSMARLAGEWGVPVYLDLAQAAGQYPLDLRETGCAFAAASGNKWLLGPLGTAWFYVRRDWCERLELCWTGSHSGEVDREGDAFAPHPGARRFEFGGRHWPLVAGLVTAIEWVGGFGWDAVRTRSVVLASALKATLAETPGVRLLTPLTPENTTGIVTFTVQDRRNEDLVRALWDEYGILCRSTLFNGVRISLAFFNTEDEVARIADAVRALARLAGLQAAVDGGVDSRL